MITSDNIREIATGQGDDYTTGCLLDYNYFTNYYKMRSIGNVLKVLTKNVLIPLGLTVAASATDMAIYKKMFGSGRIGKVSNHTCPLDGLSSHTTIISNEEIIVFMKIIRSLEASLY